jgi:hypothetical protein
MSEVLLALALTTCAQDEDTCTFTSTSEQTVVTVCGVAPDKEGRPISLEATLRGEEHLFVLEPKCNDV